MCVSGLPRSALEGAVGETRTRHLSNLTCYHSTIEPQGWCLMGRRRWRDCEVKFIRFVSSYSSDCYSFASFVCLRVQQLNSAADSSVVVITPQLVSLAHHLRRTISSHLLPGFVRSADFYDDLVLDTANAQTTIRINQFQLPHKACHARTHAHTHTHTPARQG